jgi:hypothetical protein
VLLIRLIPPNRSYTSVFIEEGDWTLYKLISRANSANLANNRSTKLGTLIYSAYARTVWPQGRTIQRLNLVPSICPLPFGGAEQTKSNLTRCDYIGSPKHLATY